MKFWFAPEEFKQERPMDDKGTIFIARHEREKVTITVRSPGSKFESKVTLPFDVWERIAIPPDYAVSTAGDLGNRIQEKS